MPARAPVTTWTQCAREIVITTIGTPELPGLKTVPRQPANPRVVPTTKRITTMSATVALIERRSSAAETTTSTKAMGASVTSSRLVASAKVRLSTTPPVT